MYTTMRSVQLTLDIMTSGITTSLLTTLISCPELFSIYCHTNSFGYSDILNNDTSQITTHILCPKALNHCKYNDKHSSLTVLASPSKKIARHISLLVPKRHVTKHVPVKNMPAWCASIQYTQPSLIRAPPSRRVPVTRICP